MELKMQKTDLEKRKLIKLALGTLVLAPAVICSACTSNKASIDNKKCMGCGACISACPEGAITRQNGKIKIAKSKCSGCAKCVSECSFGAITI